MGAINTAIKLGIHHRATSTPRSENSILAQTPILAKVGSSQRLRSARSQRIEVITRGERRRAWGMERKREIVIESLQLDARPADVARRHGINTGLLYTWRRQMLAGQLGEAPRLLPRFARVEMTATRAAPDLSDSRPGRGTRLAEPVSIPVTPSISGVIEITLPSGISLRVGAQVDSRTLRRVLAALEGR